jgi:acyl-CoA synthetase (AMP-forming)/AMP-acid ligase II
MRNNLGLVLAKRAQISREIEALVEVERGHRYTYAELNAVANRAAHALAERGIGKGDRVALLLMNGVEFLATYFGGAKIGAVTVPLNWRLVADELEFILKDAGAKVLIWDPDFDETVTELRGRDLPIERWIRVGEASERGEAWDDICAAASTEEPEIAAENDDLLFIMYTSGTTGLPKGVVHTHDSVLWGCITTNATADTRIDDRYLQVLPLFHVGALSPTTNTLYRGSTLVMMRSFDPHRIFRVIEEEHVTTMLAVPAMLQFMWASPEREKADLSSIRWIMSGAAPLPLALIEQYHDVGIEVHQVYGLTETGGPACLISPHDAVAKAGSTGPAFLHTDVRVVDESGADVEPGEVGEVEPSRGHGRVPARRLAVHRRPREPGCGRLRLHPGSKEGHDHLGWRERVPRRDRERAAQPPGRLRRGGDRHGVEEVG